MSNTVHYIFLGENLQKGKNAMSATYHRQTAHFSAVVLQNMPALPGSVMQRWIQDPTGVRERLSQAFGLSWHEEDGVIYFSVTSNGFSGQQWIDHCMTKGIQLSRYAKDVLLSKEFKPTNGVTYNVAVLKGELFADDDRITSKIRAEAECRKLTKPPPELACLIRDMFTDAELKAMGLDWIVAMHEPIEDSGGDPHLLSTYRFDGGWLDTYDGYPGSWWIRVRGFAFLRPQVEPST